MISRAATNGVSESDLVRGHAVLTSQCTACHGLQPVGRYSLKEWRDIVDDMSPRAKLNALQKSQLLAYVTAARESLP